MGSPEGAPALRCGCMCEKELAIVLAELGCAVCMCGEGKQSVSVDVTETKIVLCASVLGVTQN